MSRSTIAALLGLSALACPAPDEGTGSRDTGSSDAPTDTGLFEPSSPVAPFPTGEFLVVPHGDGVSFYRFDGTEVGAATWPELVGSCAECGGEGASADGEGLLLSFTTGRGTGRNRPGAIARVNADGTFDFRIDGFGFPHDVVRDPADSTLVVAETANDRLAWLPQDRDDATPTRTLTSGNPDFPTTPNGLERLEVNDRTYLLVSHRPTQGRITFWDITDPDDPFFLWRFPPVGQVDLPHSAILRQIESQWWLVFAHTGGLGNRLGTVGLAVTDNLLNAPVYVADLQPNADTGDFDFLRGVELTDGRLFVTDSGAEPDAGRIMEAAFPDLEPPATGETGARGNQVYVDLGPTTTVVEGLDAPFEAWRWARE